MEKANIPKIRFDKFNDDWEQRKLGDMGSTFTGLSGKTKEDFGHGEAKFITYMNVFSNPVANLEMTESVEIDTKQNSVKKGDVFFTTSSETSEEVGMSCVMPENKENIYLNSFCFGYRPTEKFDLDYLAYVLRTASFRKEMTFLAQGISRYNISKNKVMEVSIPVPNLEEQAMIGGYFSNLDHLITLHQRKYEKLQMIKKSMLEKMFPQNGEKKPEIRFEGFTDDWEQRKLGEVATYKNGKGHEDNQSDEGTYELINLNSISIDGGLKPSGKFIEDGSDTLLENDLVMVLSDVGHGDLLGRVAIIPENNRFVLNQRVALLRINDDTNPYFLFSIINRHQDYFKKLGAGSSQLNISRGTVEDFVVDYPCQDEQRKIAKCFQNLDTLITLHQRKLEKLRNIKKSMLEKMFV